MFGRLVGTKTFWLGLGSILGGAALIVTGDIAQGVTGIVAGLGMIFVRDSEAKTQLELRDVRYELGKRSRI